MNPAPTPRTDAILNGFTSAWSASPTELLELARQLERELAEAKLVVSTLSKAADKLEADKEHNARLCDEVKAQAERLAGALENIDARFQLHPNMGGGGGVTFFQGNGAFEDVMAARKELAAWKEGR